MRKILLIIILCALFFVPPLYAKDKEGKIDTKKRIQDISKEDLEVIKHMETLELMEIAEDLDMLREMDFLIEDEPNEEDN